MKFSCTQENLKQGLNNVVHIAGKNINLPILSNVLIEVIDNNIKLITTDLEIGVTCGIRGRVEKSGKFTVNAKLLYDYVNLLPNKRVDLEALNNELILKSEGQKTKIKGEDPEDYPIIPQVETKEFKNFNFNDLKRSVAEVIFAAASDETRIELSGVCLNFMDKELILTATDSYRLAEKKLKYKNKNSENNKKIIIPAKTLQELIKLTPTIKEINLDNDAKDQEVKIFISDNQVLFTYDDIELVSRIIEGQYPDYEQIIPQAGEENKTMVEVENKEFSRAIKTASLFSKTNINDVHLDFPANKKKIIVSAVGGQFGENTSEVSAEIKGKDNGVALNYKYLLDGINAIADEIFILEIIDGNTPLILKKKENKDYLYIIMPIKQ